MTTQTTSYAVTDAGRPLWVGQTPAAWGESFVAELGYIG
jgi:hypothetical protein